MMRLKMADKNQKQIWIDATQWQVLKQISDKTMAPIAALVRKAIDEYLTRADLVKKEEGK